MKRYIAITSLAVLVAAGVASQGYAGCGACGAHAEAEVTKACPPGCTKPCCESADTAKKECGSAQKKPCGDAAACDAKKSSSTCAVKGACSVKGASKCADKSAKACGPDCKKPCCAKEEIAEVNTLGLKALLDAGAKVVVLDARSGKYDDGRRIPGAKGLAANASEKEIKKAIRKKDALVVTYCAGPKCPASAMLAERLKELGYENVIEYRHGIKGWTDAGYEVKTTK